MQRIGTVRNGGIAGLVFVVLVMVAGFMAPVPPDSGDPAADFLEYLADNRNVLMFQASLTSLAAIPLVLFGPALGRFLAATEGENGLLSRGVVIMVVGSWPAGALLAMFFGGLAYVSESLPAEDARHFTLIINAGYAGLLASWAAMNLAIALILSSAKDATRWVAILALLAALGAVVGTFGWADSGILQPGASLLFGYVLTMLTLLVVSVFMIRSKDA